MPEWEIVEGYTIIQNGHEVQVWTPERIVYLYTIVTEKEVTLDLRTFDPYTGEQTSAQRIELWKLKE